MKTPLIIAAIAVIATALAADRIFGENEEPQTPANDGDYHTLELVTALNVSLAKPMQHTWSAENPKFDQGTLLVLRADPELLRRRAQAGPLLQWGAETLILLNDGGFNGHVVAIRPQRDGQGLSAQDVLFAGPALLAEQATKAHCEECAQRALELGFSASGFEAESSETKVFADEAALYHFAADLVAQFSPDEKDCIQWLSGEQR